MIDEKIRKGEIPSIPIPVSARSGAKPRFRLWKSGFILLGVLYGLHLFTHSWSRHWHKPSTSGEEHHASNWYSEIQSGDFNQENIEAKFLAVPSESSALSSSRHYATKPHLASSDQDLATAKDFLSQFQKEFGIDTPDNLPLLSAGSPESQKATRGITSQSTPSAWIDTYYPILNTPLDHSVQILDKDRQVVWSADLEEDGDPLDPDAEKYRTAVTAWHGLSYNGEATGPLVYANYGRREDYAELVKKGVNLTGTVVLVRYGGVFRGLKVKGAQELGATAVLIYSDPRDNGAVTVSNGYKPYPAGPALNPTSVQRGSVQYLSTYPGDPTTPGFPSYENSTRVPAENVPSIPSLPISWSNAERLVEELKDSLVSSRTIKVVNHVDDKVMPIYNTMGVIPGHIKDEIVMLGNHRDAWVMGAADPTSGTVSTLEIVRGLGALYRSGWRPLRSIVVASWDAEEYGLVGSTEYGEDFSDFIQENVAAYLNVDVSVAGSRFHIGASPSLSLLVRDAASDIQHPTDQSRSLWSARNDRGPYTGPSDPDVEALYEEKLASAATSTGVTALGSGSDYTVFLQRLGIASIDGGFGSTLSDSVYHYHSIYDSQMYQEKYADPGFHRHVAVAKYLGLVTLRMSTSMVLPINTTQYAFELDEYLDKVEDLSTPFSEKVNFKKLRRAISRVQIASLALDKEKAAGEKKFREEFEKWKRGGLRHCRRLRARRIRQWIKWLFGVGEKQQNANHEKLKDPRPPKLIEAAKRVHRNNKKLMSFERGFISQNGIKDRGWYRHLGVAPGKWLGYGATTLPALTESITIEANATLAQRETDRIQVLLDKLARTITP